MGPLEEQRLWLNFVALEKVRGNPYSSLLQVELLDASKQISIGLFRQIQSQEPSTVSSSVPFSGSRTFTGSFFGSFQGSRTFLRSISRSIFKSQKVAKRFHFLEFKSLFFPCFHMFLSTFMTFTRTITQFQEPYLSLFCGLFQE